MRLSDRYLELLTELDACLAQVWDHPEPAQRTCSRERAAMLQEQCGAIAHCMAVFGDLAIQDLTGEHVKKAESMRCSGKHAWLNGLRLARPDLFAPA